MDRKSGKSSGPDDPANPDPLPPLESAKPIPPSKITDELERAAAEAKAAPRPGLGSEFDLQEAESPPADTPPESIYDAPRPPDIVAAAPRPEAPAAKAVQAIPKPSPKTGHRWIVIALCIAGLAGAVAIILWR